MGRGERGQRWVSRFGPGQQQWLAAAEVAVVFAGVLLYIWRWQFVFPFFALYLVGFIVVSFFVHRDTPKTLGLGAQGLAGTLGEALLVTAALAVALVAIGVATERLTLLRVSTENLWLFVRYFGWCLFQQVGMQSFFTNRLLAVFARPRRAALASGVMFAAFHLPNPVLVPVTFIGGFLLAWLFARRRNVLALALGQALIGTLAAVVFPPSWHHGMRVGPGYYL
ncbi:MAG: type II CAAX prenyl endopeptidase Rce1 family protein [Terriglobia bacterium]